MTLTSLSMARFAHSILRAPTKQPHVPTNAERLQALRGALVPTVGNAYPWPHLRREARA